MVFTIWAIPRHTRDFCPTRAHDDRFYWPETQGRYLGKPVPNHFVDNPHWNCPSKKEVGKVEKLKIGAILRSGC